MQSVWIMALEYYRNSGEEGMIKGLYKTHYKVNEECLKMELQHKATSCFLTVAWWVIKVWTEFTTG
jgi:hypothetical protein